MLLAINYLHQSKITHRDLKPQNWLIKNHSKISKSSLKLIDFGVSKRFKANEPMHTKVGTPPYFAPEVLDGSYDEKADMWSLGVITHIMISGELPFEGKSTVDLIVGVKSADVGMTGPHWDAVSAEAKSFVRAMLQRIPQGRSSAMQGLHHVWLEMNESDNCVSAAHLTKLDVSRLKAWTHTHNMKKAALTVIATQLDNKRIDHLKALFISMDQNQDGTLSVQEMREGFAKAGADLPTDVDKLFQAVDLDGSGAIDYTEFLASTLNKKQYLQRDVVWAAFEKFDKDGSGSIDRLSHVLDDQDVLQVMHLGNKDYLERMLKEVDTNGDGVIDFEEFFAMLGQHEKVH